MLKDTFDEDGDPIQSVHYQVEVIRSDGSKASRRGDLFPHITPAQRSALSAFLDGLRTQAEGEFLP
jgi:hypothetical protein